MGKEGLQALKDRLASYEFGLAQATKPSAIKSYQDAIKRVKQKIGKR